MWLLLQMLIPMIIAVAVVREKENGNIEQLLVRPVKPYEIILGKLIPYMGICLIIAVTIIQRFGGSLNLNVHFHTYHPL